MYTVSDWVFRDLNKTVGDFRDKTLLAFDRDKITAVDGEAQGRRVQAGARRRQASGARRQRRANPTSRPSTSSSATLHDLKGYEVLADHPSDLAQYGLDQPLLTLTVFGEERSRRSGRSLLAPRRRTPAKNEYTGDGGGRADGVPGARLSRSRGSTSRRRFRPAADADVGAGTPDGPAVQVQPRERRRSRRRGRGGRRAIERSRSRTLARSASAATPEDLLQRCRAARRFPRPCRR